MGRAGRVLMGFLLAGLAVAAGAGWVDDGDGTCRAIYRPNLERSGCAGKLAPTALTAAGLAAGAVLAWAAAVRRDGRPGRFAVAGVAGVLAAVVAVVLVGSVLDRRSMGGAGDVAPAPVPVATSAPGPAPAPGVVPPTTSRP